MESHQARVLVQLRDMLLRGEFAAGERLAEVSLAERLKVSRTPVRVALATLEGQGLIEAASSGGGYMVRRFTPREIADAIAVRAVLEGVAAKLIAEHGVPRNLALDLQECLADGDRVVANLRDEIAPEDIAHYIDMNNHFHELIVKNAGNEVLARSVDLTNHLPFASPSALMPMLGSPKEARETMQFAHRQHHQVVQAMLNGQGARSQALMEEHGHVPDVNLQHALERRNQAANLLPGMRLVVETTPK